MDKDSYSEVTDAKMMINVLMGQDVAGDSGSLRDVGNAVLLVNVQPEKDADKSNALGVVGSVRKMDKDAEETVTVRLRTAVDHSGTGGVGSAALPVIVPQERSAGANNV